MDPTGHSRLPCLCSLRYSCYLLRLCYPYWLHTTREGL
jgi:hypothetical protein